MKQLNNIKTIVQSWYPAFKCWLAKREADSLHSITGKKYYVILSEEGNYLAVNNDWIKAYNRNLQKPNRISYDKLALNHIYQTK